jgi:hypothetical protein
MEFVMAGREIRIERCISLQGGYVLAEIHLYLPIDDSTYDLDSTLICLDKAVWGLTLSPRFGVLDTSRSARCMSLEKSFPLAIDSIQPAIEWIDEQVDSAMRVLREVVAERKAIGKHVPKLEPLVFDLDGLAE